jgi:hypothetical protein
MLRRSAEDRDIKNRQKLILRKTDISRFKFSNETYNQPELPEIEQETLTCLTNPSYVQDSFRKVALFEKLLWKLPHTIPTARQL